MKNRKAQLCARVGALILAVCLAGGLGACSDDDSGQGACEANLLPGTLVITEVMPDPAGADDGKEWFEIYNPTSAAIDLTGLTLVYSRADGTNRKTHVVESAIIGPGDYLVFGGVLEVAMPAHVDYPYANDLGSLTNTGGRLALECNDTLVDEIVYLQASSGESLSYDGRLAPDAVGNDTLTDWCDSITEYEPGSLGTPGAANDPCPGGPIEDKCLESGVERDILPPAAGSVVITELMPNPNAASDADGEWFEVYFAQNADLNGLQLGNDVGTVDFTVTDASCLPVAAGTYVLFAVEGESSLNGGLPPVDVIYSGVSLSNSGGSLFVGYNDVVLDQLTYTGAMVSDGASTSLDSAILSATENDDATNWCDGVDVFGAGDRGTPGAANPSCGFVPPDTCIDPISSNSRAIVAPVAGDVVITEFMANPNAVADAQGEWFEVYFAQDADLNGLQLGTAGNPTAVLVQSADCLPVTAGSYVVFARNADSGTNGGLTNVAYTFTFNLVNSNGSVSVGRDGVILDQVTFASTTAGVASALSDTARDVTANDDPANWCAATVSYGGGDLGTPGTANATCP